MEDCDDLLLSFLVFQRLIKLLELLLMDARHYEVPQRGALRLCKGDFEPALARLHFLDLGDNCLRLPTVLQCLDQLGNLAASGPTRRLPTDCIAVT